MNPTEPSGTKAPFYNLPISVLDRQEFFRELQLHLSENHRVTINFLNAHCFNVAQTNSEYKAALEKCTFLLNDGLGIEIAARLIGLHFKDNMNGTDLIPHLLAYFAKNELTVFCYGAKKEVIERAVKNIEISYSGISVVGYSHGFVENQMSVVNQINQSRADAVILGLGVPRQELWVDRYTDQLEFVKVFVSGGAIFDFISGNVMRAPPIIRRLRLEWVFRLAQEPRRLFSRYVLGNFLFLYYVLVRRG